MKLGHEEKFLALFVCGTVFVVLMFGVVPIALVLFDKW